MTPDRFCLDDAEEKEEKGESADERRRRNHLALGFGRSCSISNERDKASSNGDDAIDAVGEEVMVGRLEMLFGSVCVRVCVRECVGVK